MIPFVVNCTVAIPVLSRVIFGSPAYKLADIFAPKMNPILGLYPIAGSSDNPDFLLSGLGFDLRILPMIPFKSVVSVYCFSCPRISIGIRVQKNKKLTNRNICNDTENVLLAGIRHVNCSFDLMEDGKFRIRENSFFALLAARKLGVDQVALTLGNTVHLYNTSAERFRSDRRWVKHELKHVAQFRQYGFCWFIILYTMESMQKGYYHNRFEQEARAAEMD